MLIAADVRCYSEIIETVQKGLQRATQNSVRANIFRYSLFDFAAVGYSELWAWTRVANSK